MHPLAMLLQYREWGGDVISNRQFPKKVLAFDARIFVWCYMYSLLDLSPYIVGANLLVFTSFTKYNFSL